MALSSRGRLEIATAILLGLVSVATAFGAYQATVWSVQAASYSSISQQLRDRNLTAALSSQLVLKDDGAKVFEAISRDAEAIAFPERAEQLAAERELLIASASPELATAWQAWVESGYEQELVPISSPGYESALFAEPHSLRYASLVAEDLYDELQSRSDIVTTAAVIFAIALFVLGIAGVNISLRVATALVVAGAVALIAGSVVIALALA